MLPAQTTACEGIDDLDPCIFLELRGVCVDGACQIGDCGNGEVEPGEVCDDGNVEPRDGCNADCRSDETCGNDYLDIDVERVEQCDSGVPRLAGDGCTSTCNAEFDIWQDSTPKQLVPLAYAAMAYDEARDEIVLFGGYRNNGTASSETWVFTGGAWEQRFPASAPEARWAASMAYYPKLGKVVLVGGSSSTSKYAGTWTWDGHEWNKLAVANEPTGRSAATMAYHPASDVLMLYGGTTITGSSLDDTYSFNGTAWTKLAGLTLTPQGAHGSQPYHSMFLDPGSGDLLMFAGTSGTAPVGYMYRWGATGWADIGLTTTDTSPPAHIEVYLGRTGTRPTLFGGRFTSTLFSNKTYLWNNDLNRWDLIAPSVNPSTRYAGGAAWNVEEMLIFGGFTGGGPSAGTYRLDNARTRWTSIPTTPIPTERFNAATAYDARRGDVVVFGGTTGGLQVDDTWRWDAPVWKVITPLPSARERAALAFDEAREETVLFGGNFGCGLGSGSNIGPACPGSGSGSGGGSGSSALPTIDHDDTYVLTDGIWSLRDVSVRPSPRASAAMTYAPGHGTLLFGGDAQAIRKSDTWLWDGTMWKDLQPTSSPPPMTGGRLVFDRVSNVAVLYGGEGALGTIWLFDFALSAWTEAVPPTGPAPEPRTSPVFVYNPRRNRVLLFGGKSAAGQLLADTWEFETVTRTWEERHPVQLPPLRYDASAVYDSLNSRVMLYGGVGVSSNALEDVWTYSFVSNTPGVDLCDGTDADADELIDCADPDCYPRCDPYCPPATTCVDVRARCGDGVCSPVEEGVCADCPPN